MSNTNNIVPVPSATPTTTPSSGKKRGRQPIKSLADVKASIMLEIISTEIGRIDSAIKSQTGKRATAQARVNDANAAIIKLNGIRAEFLKDSNILA